MWHSITTSDQGLSEVSKFISSFAKQYAREVEQLDKINPNYPLKPAYLLHRREVVGTGVQVIYLPEEVMHLVKKMDGWQDKIRVFEGEPDLTNSHPIPVN